MLTDEESYWGDVLLCPDEVPDIVSLEFLFFLCLRDLCLLPEVPDVSDCPDILPLPVSPDWAVPDWPVVPDWPLWPEEL